MKKYKYGTPGRVLNYAAPLYDKVMNFFMSGYDANLSEIIYEDIKKYLPLKKILDIGCGTGSISAILTEKFKSEICAGIDAAPKMVSLAHKKFYGNKSLQFANAVSEKLPYKDNAFDCVINTMFLHHIPFDSKIQTFQEIYRVLKPGGLVYTVDLSKPSNLFGVAALKISAAMLIQSEISENADYSLDFFVLRGGFKDVIIKPIKFGMVFKCYGFKPSAHSPEN